MIYAILYILIALLVAIQFYKQGDVELGHAVIYGSFFFISVPFITACYIVDMGADS